MNDDRESSQDISAPNNTASTMPAASSEGPGNANSSAGMSRGVATSTVTLTEEATQTNEEVLRLTLHPRPHVRWDENVVDNEGLGRKSSKRCCIFHKQRAFDESSTDSSEEEFDGSDSDDSGGEAGKKNHRKIARPKKGKKVPDYQRFHA